ncbi:hypothetical protein [Hymenobacter jeollabukensis]|uniref:Uncharacterized protein n=1 Tax=Hymenobacter jeollabukensis TaxID=2025313 RepID=A0A5R8WUX0_9BACT|nr:hypothetical protein [Hymenobacter jeollabukensis]TLM95571.1 hypothetical protein FDY95_07245 [Hymenobacter jeollabukensis]
MATAAGLPADEATTRQAAWDTALPDLVDRTLAQWCAPLAGVRGGPNKATVLGILYAALHEQQQRRPGYAAFAALDPVTIQEIAVHLPDEQAFHQYIYLEAGRRVLHELRQLQLRSLGYKEQPSLLDTIEETYARLQREEHHRALLQAAQDRTRPVASSLAALFVSQVDVSAVVAALQANEVLTDAGRWDGSRGRANDLMALVLVWQEGGYLVPAKWIQLMRSFMEHFGLVIPESYARRRDKANPEVVQAFARLFPGRGKITRVQLRLVR